MGGQRRLIKVLSDRIHPVYPLSHLNFTLIRAAELCLSQICYQKLSHIRPPKNVMSSFLWFQLHRQ